MVVLDGKRNDIGSTAVAYARGYLGRGASAWQADALTISPYLGDDSLTPFVEVATERGAGLYVLVKTSNPGSGMLQDLVADGKKLYRRVGKHVELLATETAGECGYGSVGAVVGATYPEQLAELRAAMPHTWFLVPGLRQPGWDGGRRCRRIRRPRPRCDRQQLARHSLRAFAPRIRRPLRRRAVARSRRGRDPRDDRPVARGSARFVARMR